jgi:hypothetical protein
LRDAFLRKTYLKVTVARVLQYLGGGTMPDTAPKQLQKASLMKLVVDGIGGANLSDLAQAGLTVLLLLANVLTARSASRAEVLVRFESLLTGLNASTSTEARTIYLTAFI